MAYYAKSGEPPGQWAGRGAERLGLRGQVDPDVIQNLYMKNTAPTGEVLAKTRKQDGVSDVAAARAVHAYQRQHPYASAVELDEVRAKERAKQGKTSVPYYDETVSMVKSASVLHASYKVGAMLERAAGDAELAGVLDARADAIEGALMDAARDAVRWLEQHAAYTRTGYHSSTTGEWRDAEGLTAGLFLHHLSRDGDPHLHVHIAIWNRVQRADGADGKYRTLHSRAVFRHRAVMAKARSGYIQQLPSGAFRVSVYAGTDPLTGRQIRLRRTCKTERAAQIELGRLLEQTAAGSRHCAWTRWPPPWPPSATSPAMPGSASRNASACSPATS